MDKLSMIELKALAYDALAQAETAQIRLKELNAEISKRFEAEMAAKTAKEDQQ